MGIFRRTFLLVPKSAPKRRAVRLASESIGALSSVKVETDMTLGLVFANSETVASCNSRSKAMTWRDCLWKLTGLTQCQLEADIAKRE